MDSTLLSLFAIPNRTVTDNILKKDLNVLKDYPILWSTCDSNLDKDIKKRKNIQKELNNITESMRTKHKKQKCSTLRSLIRRCPGSQAFHETDTQDAGEFLSYLLNLFQVDVAKTRRRSYGSNDVGLNPDWTLVRSLTDNKASPIIDVTSTRLKEIPQDYDITKFVKQKEDSLLPPSELWTPDKKHPEVTYSRRKEVFRMKESPLIIFNLVRTYGEVKFAKPRTKKEKEAGRGKFKGIVTHNIWTRIAAPETMTKNLELTAIVVHTGGAHYVANFKCEGEWYWYNDNPGEPSHEIKYVGSYDKMLKTTPKPLTHGTLFFYT